MEYNHRNYRLPTHRRSTRGISAQRRGILSIVVVRQPKVQQDAQSTEGQDKGEDNEAEDTAQTLALSGFLDFGLLRLLF